MYLVRQIPDNIDRVVSGLKLTKVCVSCLANKKDLSCIQVNKYRPGNSREYWIEFYLVRQIPDNTDRVVSGLILTKVLLRNLEFKI